MSLKVTRMSNSDVHLPGFREFTRHISREEFENAQPLISLSQSAPHASVRTEASHEEEDGGQYTVLGRLSPSDNALKGTRHDQAGVQAPRADDVGHDSTTPSVEGEDISVVGQVCR